ncbi:MAG: hypothetical protein QM737_10160 [Ferruginibacter sp.]
MMKRSIKLVSLLLIAVSLIATSCSSSRKSGHCSCAGMVGYGNR